MDDAAESVVSADVEAGDVLWVGDRCGYCTQWRNLFHRPQPQHSEGVGVTAR